MGEFWQGLGRGARTGLLAGVLVILLATAGLAWWALRTDYQVLFSDLKPQDASALGAELDKLKIPYQVDDSGTALLVDKEQVPATRMKLMGKELPLQGAVGFELFNNTDFGMTEFAQKINYQRALQGELTRTILSLAEIRDVRVHLALPEQGLFKQASARPKAAITVTLRDGMALRPAQVSGIQRLVAAATPGMTAQDVTVVDRQGVALSRLSDGSDAAAASDTGAGSGNTRLELKKDTEDQLARKAAAVLDQAFGAGQALASVDVTLNMDQVRVTTEDVVPATTRTGDSKGVVVKERESVRDGNVPPLDIARQTSGGTGSSTQREVDYQVGRRVEQVVGLAGAIRRVQVVAVVRKALTPAQEDRVRTLLSAAVGAIAERGDTIVVQSLAAWSSADAPADRPASADPVAGSGSGRPAEVTGRADTVAVHPTTPGLPVPTLLAAALAAALLLLVVVLLRGRRHPTPAERVPPMTDVERQQALRKVRAWMAEAEARP